MSKDAVNIPHDVSSGVGFGSQAVGFNTRIDLTFPAAVPSKASTGQSRPRPRFTSTSLCGALLSFGHISCPVFRSLRAGAGLRRCWLLFSCSPYY